MHIIYILRHFSWDESKNNMGGSFKNDILVLAS